jgi:rhodanese-related sulfurtransferase
VNSRTTATSTSPETITPADLTGRLSGSRPLTVIDVRTPAEYEAAHGSAGQPVRRGRPRWTLERQVRLVAGSLVAGSVLVSLRFPRVRYLAGGVGAGLAAAAVTDSCAMGAALARLPYNRGGRPVSLADAREALRS